MGNHQKQLLEFRLFLENDEKYDSLKADIPLPSGVMTLVKLFRRHGEELFAVGGVVRDYLYSKFHNKPFAPKDVDIATSAQPDRVMDILSSDEAKALGIKPFPKGESFGVISAIVDGEEFEIATFREEWYDPEAGDGRRPDEVSFSTPGKDAQRRDLTINALFYNIGDKEIRDYNLDANGEGQGFKDLKDLVARPVGNSRDRFREDKLRVLRLIRFFSRFNPGEILKNLDPEILDAIQEFKELSGVSPERISNEFIAGLQKSINPVSYLSNYTALGLWPTVLPGLHVDKDGIPAVGKEKNVAAVLAWILKDNGQPKNVRQKLNALTYSNQITNRVEFLLKLYKFNPEEILSLIKQRDSYLQLDEPARAQAGQSQRDDLEAFARIARREPEMQHFLSYRPSVQSKDFMHLKGPEIGRAMKAAERDNYLKSQTGN